MDIAALIFSGLAIVIAGLGAFLANRRANEALQESRKAVSTALWSGLQEAVQRLVGFDPSAEPIGERLANLRIASINLVDEYTDWEGLDTWLESERVLGATLGRQVMEAAKPGGSVEQRVKSLDPLISWTQALSQNLRLFRRTGYDKEALTKLQGNAADLTRRIHKRHGWELPPTLNPHLSPLD